VKYHTGAQGKFVSSSGEEMVVSVAPNPSHLESVDPVVQGIVRAKQDLLDRRDENPVLSVLLHGDAAFAGQGVVAETLNLSALSGYGTGGTIHIIVNNQLGFTTGSNYGRSSTYASDVAKMVQAPIFHVNGEDPEACVRAAQLAFQFQREYKKDVVIDMWCYRRWGHNESDEPAFTQPLMYARIEGRRSIRKLYTEALVNRGDLPVEEAEQLLEEYRVQLQQAFDETKGATQAPKEGELLAPIGLPEFETAVDRQVLDDILERVTSFPDEFNVHPKLQKWLAERKTALERNAIDWSLGEALGIGSILLEGTTVRLTGQDTRRGTFSQRHSTLVDQETGEEYVPLKNLKEGQGKFFVIDSLLSEFAAVGFEYGYSLGDPKALVLWEAQFGDFVNGAQVVIDQFISAGEDKWNQKSGIALLLPHGYEGQGPEHSSARLERFLALSAEDNIQVVVPSTPAQYFHVLRRQVHLEAQRRPLVVLTPKSFLRLPAARSTADDLTAGSFGHVINDPARPEKASRLIFCSGKIYYDLAKHREEKGLKHAALVRIEQLYPFPIDKVRNVMEQYETDDVCWVQEEPENMGAWRFIRLHFLDSLGTDIKGITRLESASPATGSAAAHQWEQERLMASAFS
jgi:2-oxoglutarate dehydrogenase E1 component